MVYRDFLGHAKFHASFALYQRFPNLLDLIFMNDGTYIGLPAPVEGENSPMTMGFSRKHTSQVQGVM